jgi:hypothetical protein
MTEDNYEWRIVTTRKIKSTTPSRRARAAPVLRRVAEPAANTALDFYLCLESRENLSG